MHPSAWLAAPFYAMLRAILILGLALTAFIAPPAFPLLAWAALWPALCRRVRGRTA